MKTHSPASVSLGALVLVGSIGALSSCASASAGTRPGDMSAAAHEREAEAAVQWTSAAAASPQEQEARRRALALAAEHRGAARALRDAEATHCVGIAEADRELSPFAHTGDIEKVTQLYGPAPVSGKGPQLAVIAGATIRFRAVPGLTREWLQRTIDCHLARNAALGNGAAADAACPLVLKGVQATVRSAGGGFDVEVSSKDAATAAEIWARAQRLRG